MWLDATPLNRPGEYAAVDISALPDGGVDVAVRAGTMDQGQGHATTWGLILSGILGVPVDSVRLVRSDTASVPKGEGTGSARSLQVTGSSVQPGRPSGARPRPGPSPPICSKRLPTTSW